MFELTKQSGYSSDSTPGLSMQRCMQLGMQVALTGLYGPNYASYLEYYRGDHFHPDHPNANDVDMLKLYRDRRVILGTRLCLLGCFVGLQVLNGARDIMNFRTWDEQLFRQYALESGITHIQEIGPGGDSMLYEFRDILGEDMHLSWIGPEGPDDFPGRNGYFPEDMPRLGRPDLLVSRRVFNVGGQSNMQDQTPTLLDTRKYLSDARGALSVHASMMQRNIPVDGLTDSLRTSSSTTLGCYLNPPEHAMLPLYDNLSGQISFTDLVVIPKVFAVHS